MIIVVQMAVTKIFYHLNLLHSQSSHHESGAMRLISLSNLDIVLLPLKFGCRSGEQSALPMHQQSTRKHPSLIGFLMKQKNLL